jgi:hypothetical protein
MPKSKPATTSKVAPKAKTTVSQSKKQKQPQPSKRSSTSTQVQPMNKPKVRRTILNGSLPKSNSNNNNVSFNEVDRNTIAHDVRHDLDYDRQKDNLGIKDRKTRRDERQRLPINEYSAFVVDPQSYHPSTPYTPTSSPTSVISFKFQTTGTSVPDSDGGFSFAAQLGQASEESGNVTLGGLLPNENTGAFVGRAYANFQITDGNSGISPNTNIFSSVVPNYPAESSFQSFSNTMEKHFSGIRLIAAVMKLTPLSSNFIRDGLIYGCSAPKGGTRELGPNNTNPAEADAVNMPKIFSCPGMKTLPCSDGDSLMVTWFPKDNDSFEFVPSRTSFTSSEWNKKYRSGALILFATGMSQPQTFIVEYELFYQAIPSDATFNITGSQLSLSNPLKQSDSLNLFLTNANVHIVPPDKSLFQNFETNDVNTESTKQSLFVEKIKHSPVLKDNFKVDKSVVRYYKESDGTLATTSVPESITTYGRVQASAISKPGGSSSAGSVIGRKVKEIAKLTIPLVDIIDGFFNLF